MVREWPQLGCGVSPGQARCTSSASGRCPLGRPPARRELGARPPRGTRRARRPPLRGGRTWCARKARRPRPSLDAPPLVDRSSLPTLTKVEILSRERGHPSHHLGMKQDWGLVPKAQAAAGPARLYRLSPPPGGNGARPRTAHKNQGNWEEPLHTGITAQEHQLRLDEPLSTGPLHPMSRGIGTARAERAKGRRGYSRMLRAGSVKRDTRKVKPGWNKTLPSTWVDLSPKGIPPLSPPLVPALALPPAPGSGPGPSLGNHQPDH